MSLTLPACRQPSCCDEWAGYGVTLLPKSSTGDIHRVNSYRTLPRTGDPAAVAVDGMCHAVEEGGLQVADVANARYYGGTSTSAMSWCGRFSTATSTLAACSCRVGSGSDRTVLTRCDGDCDLDLWNNGDDVDEARDVVDRGVCAADGGHGGDLPSQHDLNARCFLTRWRTPEMTELLGDLNDNMTSSRDFLVSSDTAIGQHAGNHDNNDTGDVYDDGDDEE